MKNPQGAAREAGMLRRLYGLVTPYRRTVGAGMPVSYTHLDVYKRQQKASGIGIINSAL